MTAGRPKGYPKTGGRKAGTTNKLGSVREAFEQVFNALQEGGDASLEAWARENPTEFYKLVSKLMPLTSPAAGVVFQVITGVPHAESEDSPNNNQGAYI